MLQGIGEPLLFLVVSGVIDGGHYEPPASTGFVGLGSSFYQRAVEKRSSVSRQMQRPNALSCG